MKVGGKTLVYIGQTTQPLKRRIEQHKQEAVKNRTIYFYQALLDYGLENWDWDILITCEQDKANEQEKYFIEKFSADLHSTVLNTSHAQKMKKRTGALVPKTPALRSKRLKPFEKSKMGEMSLRAEGGLKPVLNMKTENSYLSLSEAARVDGVSKDKIRNSCKTGKMLLDGTRYAHLDIEDNPILTSGHHKDIYIGKNAKKVKNLVSGKIFDSTAEVAKALGVSSSVVDGAARGKYSIIKKKYVFCFLDDNGNEMRLPQHEQALQKLKRQKGINFCAWHVDDVERKKMYYFKTLPELYAALKIRNKSHVKSVCDGSRSHVEKWRIARWDQEKDLPIFMAKHSGHPNKIIRRLMCLSDKKVFDSVAEAGKHYGLDAQGIAMCCKGKQKTVYWKNHESKKKERLRFAYIDDNEAPILTESHYADNETLAARGKKRILLTNKNKVEETGREKFNSLAEYCRVTRMPWKRAQKYLKDNSVDMFGYEFIVLD